MGKYVRTKEGNIYQRFFKDKSIRGVGGGGCCDQNLNPIGETIIKESNTIEDVCDEFVLQGTTKLGTRFDTLNEAKTYKVECDTLYGAIWTDKGLVYVAKMNEKGEMVLL